MQLLLFYNSLAAVFLLGLLLQLSPGDAVSLAKRKKCRPCTQVHCTVFSSCPGELVRDECNCCMVCNERAAVGSAESAVEAGGGSGWPSEEAVRADEVAESIDMGASENSTEELRRQRCAEIVCESPKLCMVNIQLIALCKCPDPMFCARSRQPVCGSNGKTYWSRCHMRADACQTDARIRVAHRGRCADQPAPDAADDTSANSQARRHRRKTPRRHGKRATKDTKLPQHDWPRLFDHY